MIRDFILLDKKQEKEVLSAISNNDFPMPSESVDVKFPYLFAMDDKTGQSAVRPFIYVLPDESLEFDGRAGRDDEMQYYYALLDMKAMNWIEPDQNDEGKEDGQLFARHVQYDSMPNMYFASYVDVLNYYNAITDSHIPELDKLSIVPLGTKRDEMNPIEIYIVTNVAQEDEIKDQLIYRGYMNKDDKLPMETGNTAPYRLRVDVQNRKIKGGHKISFNRNDNMISDGFTLANEVIDFTLDKETGTITYHM